MSHLRAQHDMRICGWHGHLARADRQTLARRQCHPTMRRLALLVCVCLTAAGCGQSIQKGYGQRKGPGASDSVSGTAVLGGMFEAAGHHVFSWRMLSPRLQRADCLVWFPDDFELPDEKVVEWLTDWLGAEPGRTLIYVGRDFDAADWYWDRVKQGTPREQRAELLRRAARDKADFNTARRALPDGEVCQWFTVEGKDRSRKVRQLQGRSDWLEGIDPSGLEIELVGRMVPLGQTETLLQSKGDVLISRFDFDESQLLLVANGSFLLNLPLVNHEHRKLAGKLIDAVGTPGRTVVFLESGAAGLPINETDPTAGMPSGLEIFNVWPTNWILLHLATAGIIFCFWRWPIFGRPRELEPEASSDFGKHILALADLLAQTRDRSYAITKLLHYRQTTRPNE